MAKSKGTLRILLLVVTVWALPLVLIPRAQAEQDIVSLAKEEFPDLTASEEKMLVAVAKGEAANYQVGDATLDDPENADQWGEERMLRAKVIVWLCTDKKAKEHVTYKGVWIYGANIEGILDLSLCPFCRPLVFGFCEVDQKMILDHAKLVLLSLEGSKVEEISADSLNVEGGVFLRNRFKAENMVNLRGARIGGQLIGSGGEFRNPGGIALNGDALRVEENVHLGDGFIAEGSVILRNAVINGQLVCTSGKFLYPEGVALNGNSIHVDGSVLFVKAFKAYGEVNLQNAFVGESLCCTAGEFSNPTGWALNAGNLHVNYNTFLDSGFKAEGGVNLVGALIEGDLDCGGGDFRKPGGVAVNGDSLQVGGGLYFRRNSSVEGLAALVNARIEGSLQWQEIEEPGQSVLALNRSRIGTLWMDSNSWPERGNLILDGFVYDEIMVASVFDIESRIDWLRRQPSFSPQPYEQLAKVFRSIGREQDAREVLIAMEEDRGKIIEGFWAKFGHWINGLLMAYGYRTARTIGACFTFIAIGWLVFGVCYRKGLLKPKEVKEGPKPGFWSFVWMLMYSVDVFVPIINLRLSDRWSIDTKQGLGIFAQIFWWVLTSFGWLMVTLLLYNLGRIMQR